MEKRVTRGSLLKAAGLVTGGAAVSLGMPSAALAQEVPHSAYAEGYVRGAGLPTLLVQAVAFQVTTVGTGPVVPLGADPATGIPGWGFDVDFGQAVAGNNRDKNKGRNTSWCLFDLSHGGFNGFPPVNQGGVDAIRLEGVVVEAADPANLGVPVKVNVSSGATIEPHHSVCLIKFFFGSFGPWLGRGLAVVNQ